MKKGLKLSRLKYLDCFYNDGQARGETGCNFRHMNFVHVVKIVNTTPCMYDVFGFTRMMTAF